MTEQEPTTLLPWIDEINEPFWAGCRDGKLCIQQCPDTSRLIFPPRPGNPWSPRTKPAWTEVEARGTIWSFIEPHPPLMLDFTERAPYTSICVALDCDPTIRMIGNLLKSEDGDINDFCYEELEIGTPVKVLFRKMNDEITLPLWTPA
jgi:uncharacterized OB-fold protein